MAKRSWDYFDDPLPRNEILWHPQFARTPQQGSAFDSFRRVQGKVDTAELAGENLAAFGASGGCVILKPGHDLKGHYQLRGGVITLAELFLRYGECFTAQELMFWYYHAPKVCKKRPHSWGSKLVKEAAQVRKAVFGHYGHRRW